MKIIHVDMDQFFAAVEQRDQPELRGKPIVVGHDAERGVVSTASYEARRFGVHSAQSIKVAKRLCPQLIIVEPHFQRYKEVSMQLRDIFHDYTDMIEPISLDEASQLLQVSGEDSLRLAKARWTHGDSSRQSFGLHCPAEGREDLGSWREDCREDASHGYLYGLGSQEYVAETTDSRVWEDGAGVL